MFITSAAVAAVHPPPATSPATIITIIINNVCADGILPPTANIISSVSSYILNINTQLEEFIYISIDHWWYAMYEEVPE